MRTTRGEISLKTMRAMPIEEGERRLRGVLGLLVPDMYTSRIESVDLCELEKSGVEVLLLDLDNTLVPWGSDEMDGGVLHWLSGARKRFRVGLLSNALPKRVERWAEQLNLPAISRAAKPRRGGYRELLEELDVSPERAAVVGDQLLTDVIGGNRMGMITVLVVPLSRREFIGTRLARLFERIILSLLIRAGLTRKLD
ncbi:MAG: YqeG family HAD IIIA-type phosphatase [Bacillota bacterium]